MSTNLFAKIKKGSKYSGQEKTIRDGVYPFPVDIEASSDGYVVKGGPGARYRLKDVALFAEANGKKVKIKG